MSYKIQPRSQRVILQSSCQRAVVFGLCLLVLAFSGCSRRYDDMPAFLPFDITTERENHSVGRFKTAYLAEQIDAHYRGTSMGPIGVTTFVNLDDLYITSSFGRMCAEQMMGELTMRGYEVVELRHADALQFLADAGEFALSREFSSVRKARDLSGVVVGTYVASPERIYLNTRLIDPGTSMVLSAASAEMSRTKEIARMLRGNALPLTLERIPVRHIANSQYPSMMYPSRGAYYYMEESGPQGASDSFAYPDAAAKFYDAPSAKKSGRSTKVTAKVEVLPESSVKPEAPAGKGQEGALPGTVSAN